MNIGESILIITDRYREKTGYCSLVIIREVFFVSEDHRKSWIVWHQSWQIYEFVV